MPGSNSKRLTMGWADMARSNPCAIRPGPAARRVDRERRGCGGRCVARPGRIPRVPRELGVRRCGLARRERRRCSCCLAACRSRPHSIATHDGGAARCRAATRDDGAQTMKTHPSLFAVALLAAAWLCRRTGSRGRRRGVVQHVAAGTRCAVDPAHARAADGAANRIASAGHNFRRNGSRHSRAARIAGSR